MRRLLSLVLVLTLLLPCFGAYSADAPLLLRGQEVAELYSFDYQNRAYHRVTDMTDIASLTKTLAVLPASKGTEKTTVSDGARGFLAFLKDGTRLVWYVTSTELSDDIGVIPSTQNARDKLLNIAGRLNAKYPGSAQRVAYLDSSKIKWITCSDGRPTGLGFDYYSGNDPAVIRTIMAGFKSLEVKPSPIVWRLQPDETRPYEGLGDGFAIRIHTDTGKADLQFTSPDKLKIFGTTEELTYQIAKPEQVEALRRTMAQQKQTQLIAESYSPRTIWSTTNNELAEKIRGITRQRSGKAYTEQEYAKMQDSLNKILIGYGLNFTYWNGDGGRTLYLPTGESGKGFYWDTPTLKGWYLTEQATKELKALMQPMTRL